MKNIFKSIALATITVAAISCGDNKKSTETVHDHATTTTETTEQAPVETMEVTTSIELEGDDNMKFNKTAFSVPVGQKVTLKLTHTGKQPITSMGHNFVLLKKGVAAADFGQKAVTAAQTQYIPVEEKDNVIAHTKVIGGGESDTIEFTIEEAGEYEFLCSFPGHYGVMNGKITAVQQ
ncbi:MAG: azurin [Bacteroidota bacterium]|nr:azurin [Bacteroidota bacterium]